jgi:hypothetical protein
MDTSLGYITGDDIFYLIIFLMICAGVWAAVTIFKDASDIRRYEKNELNRLRELEKEIENNKLKKKRKKRLDKK